MSLLTDGRRTAAEHAAGEALVQQTVDSRSDHDMPAQQAVAGEAEVAEVANALLNLCYEASNVVLLLGQGQAVARLVALLAHASPDVRANAAGALQSVCFQPQGRKKVRHTAPTVMKLGCCVSTMLHACPAAYIVRTGAWTCGVGALLR